MSGSVSGEIKAEPNLTPILDMVFQLVTFFVMLFSCKQAEMAEGVELPVIGSARPVGKSGFEGAIVFNYKFKYPPDKDNPRGREPQLLLGSRLIAPSEVAAYVRGQAQTSMRHYGLTEDDVKGGKKIRDIVVIRSHKQIPFGKISTLIKACQDNGYEQFAFRAEAPAAAKP